MNVDGRSMYPFFNTDYQRSLRRDKVWVDMWNPSEGLRRGMIVAFWYVALWEFGKGEGRERGAKGGILEA